MARPILVANWKNHPSSAKEAAFILSGMSRKASLYKKLSTFIAPPLVYYEAVSKRARSFSNLASQDVEFLTPGSHTGAVGVDILKSFGVRLSIIGHSERRALGETNESISQKTKQAVRSGLTALVCVGEQVRDQDGEHFEFLRDQIKSSLEGVRKESLSKIALAYEPVWAIGKSADEAITPADLAQTVVFIRKVLTDIFGRTPAERIPVLYGGSVEPANASTLLADTGIRGFLVGHASLDPRSFQIIAESLI